MDYFSDAYRHLNNAKRIIGLKSPDRVSHAALELRLCIEALVYYQAERITEHFGHDQWKTWQPAKLINELAEIEPSAASSVSLTSIGDDGSVRFLGKTRPLTPEEIKKHYHFLGNFVHLPLTRKLPEDRQLPTSRLSALLKILEEAVRPSIISSNLSYPIKHFCKRCQNPFTKRVSDSLEECRLECPVCMASYKFTRHESNQYEVKPLEIEFVCPSPACGKVVWIWEREVVIAKRFKCGYCGSVSEMGVGLCQPTST